SLLGQQQPSRQDGQRNKNNKPVNLKQMNRHRSKTGFRFPPIIGDTKNLESLMMFAHVPKLIAVVGRLADLLGSPVAKRFARMWLRSWCDCGRHQSEKPNAVFNKDRSFSERTFFKKVRNNVAANSCC